MRARLITALVAATLAALAPFAPVAAVPTAQSSEIQWTLVLDGGPMRADRAGTFDATLASGDQPIAGVPLELWARRAGTTTWSRAAVGTTDAQGQAIVRPRLEYTSALQWRFRGSAAYAPTTAQPFLQRVAPGISARVHTHAPRAGRSIAVFGRTVPAKPGSKIFLYAGTPATPLSVEPGDSVRLAQARVRADGTYTIRYTFPSPGKRQLYVATPAGGGHARGESGFVHLRVR